MTTILVIIVDVGPGESDEMALAENHNVLLAWHRRLIARKWEKRAGRPRVMVELAELIVRLAKDNPRWAWRYTRIRGALSNLGHTVARSTIANILREHGVEPAPERSERTPWRTFLTAHWETVAGTDFFTVEVVTFGRLVTYYVLVVIELSSRKIHVAGITPGPDSALMMQVGCNLTDPLDGFLLGKRFLILDRDKKFTAEFRGLVDDAGTRVIRLPYRSPNLNAYIERFVLSIKSECLNRMIFFGAQSLRRAVAEFIHHSWRAQPSRSRKRVDRTGRARGQSRREREMPQTIGRHAQLLLPRSRIRTRCESFSG